MSFKAIFPIKVANNDGNGNESGAEHSTRRALMKGTRKNCDARGLFEVEMHLLMYDPREGTFGSSKYHVASEQSRRILKEKENVY